MEKQELLEQLKAIVQGGSSALNSEKKQLIISTAEELGVKIAKTNCKDCLIDAAVQCYDKLKESEPEDNAEYILHDGVDLLFGGVRINAATLTDELARDIVARGFALKWFKKHPEQ